MEIIFYVTSPFSQKLGKKKIALYLPGKYTLAAFHYICEHGDQEVSVLSEKLILNSIPLIHLFYGISILPSARIGGCTAFTEWDVHILHSNIAKYYKHLI